VTTTPESDEVAGHQHRLAQANRLLRFCQANGVDPQEVMNGKIDLDLDSICDAHGKVVPESIDYEAVK
jgi:predicted HicB family RNase H-like nuclease